MDAGTEITGTCMRNKSIQLFSVVVHALRRLAYLYYYYYSETCVIYSLIFIDQRACFAYTSNGAVLHNSILFSRDLSAILCNAD